MSPESQTTRPPRVTTAGDNARTCSQVPWWYSRGIAGSFLCAAADAAGVGGSSPTTAIAWISTSISGRANPRTVISALAGKPSGKNSLTDLGEAARVARLQNPDRHRDDVLQRAAGARQGLAHFAEAVADLGVEVPLQGVALFVVGGAHPGQVDGTRTLDGDGRGIGVVLLPVPSKVFAWHASLLSRGRTLIHFAGVGGALGLGSTPPGRPRLRRGAQRCLSDCGRRAMLTSGAPRPRRRVFAGYRRGRGQAAVQDRVATRVEGVAGDAPDRTPDGDRPPRAAAH